MSLLDPVLGEVFTIRVYKRYQGYSWTNAYEIQALSDAVTNNDLQVATAIIVQAERDITFAWAQFDRAVVSTYVPDGQPYNPLSFQTIPLNVPGLRPSATQHIPLTNCVFARYMAPTGRSGKRLYRAMLSEEDVDFGVHGHTISPARVNEISTRLNNMLANLPTQLQLCLASGTPNPTLVRPVTAITVSQTATVKKLNNRYYDIP